MEGIIEPVKSNDYNDVLNLFIELHEDLVECNPMKFRKIETNVKSGRWKKLDEVDSFYIQVYSYWLQRGCVKLIKESLNHFLTHFYIVSVNYHSVLSNR